MKHSTLQFAAIIFLFIQFGVTKAQIKKGELTKENTQSSTINPSEKHQYKVTLEKDQFALFKVMQKGVDLKIITHDIKGDKIEEFDSPNGKNGPELFTITSGNKGVYTIEIIPFDENEPTGNYDITLNFVKAKAVTKNERVDELFAAWDNNVTPGAAVSIVQDGGIIYKKGYGLSNLEYNIPIEPNSVFHIASVSKQFTVFSLLLLEKEGKLNLDDDIRKYIPEVPDFGKTITLRHLASHTSGLRDQWNLLIMAGWRMDDVITKEHILKLISRQKELNFNPGDEFLYCNTGFTLLAEVVSRVSERSFAAFTKARIFDPLKMNHTLFYDDHEKIVKNRTYSYHADSTGFKKSVLNFANVGATSLFTTVEDLSLWSLNFSNTIVGDTAIINKMNTQTVLNNGKTISGALGQFVGHYKGIREIQHGGADAGYRSYLTRLPDENFSVMVFSNSAEFNSGGMAHKIVDIYLNDKIKVKPEKKNAKKEKETPNLVVDQEILKTYVGNFELQPGFNISITENNGDLFAQATGQNKISLIPQSITEFKVEGVEAKVEFIPNAGQKVTSMKLHQGGQVREAPRMKAFDKESVDLSDFSGWYYSEELMSTFNFIVDDGKLVAKHNRLSDFDLNPVKKDVFSGTNFSFREIKFIRNENDQISGCKVSNGRVRNLYFKKIN